jgi:heme-degrading monooxygenase HmoA
MSIVRINAIEVPEGMGEVLEQRFAARLGAVDSARGFEGFELLRPTGDSERRYFVVTHWRSVEDFDAWLASDDFGRGHSGAGAPAGEGPEAGHGGAGHPGGGGHPGAGGPVGVGSAVLEFDVVMSSTPKG